MTEQQQREAARQFYYKWNGKGREDEDARSYWIDIIQDVLGADRVTDRLDFEKKVIGADGNTKRIDVYIPETHTLIEQKSLGIALDKQQASHGGMTPYEQAKMYDNGLPHSEKARWIVTSNFSEIWIYDMDQKKPEPVKIILEELQTKYHMLDFLVQKNAKARGPEVEVSLQAGELVGKLYDAFLKQYQNPESPETLKSLNKLCVRIVFCLYAEDADVFGRKRMFHDYMAQFDAQRARKGLQALFRILNQKPEKRDPYLAQDDPMLAAFPYVNGGLFEDDNIEIPPFTDEILHVLLDQASDKFDWSRISPTIFGAVFESTLNPETRRSGGMHYTSIENIHKVIDPLFLDDLKAELEEIKKIDVYKDKKKKLIAFQDKLASLVFLDPAAGSGNFLTETYTCLRKLENQVILLLTWGQMSFAQAINPIKVSISQFYGIEINDFAVTVARTALWIAENQMMMETEDIIQATLDFLPLKTNAYIVEGNALRIDWGNVVPKEKLSYIMGNPPFVGYSLQTPTQKADVLSVYVDQNGKTYGNAGKIDYVAGWYHKAVELIQGTKIQVAFVSTNSLTQGEQVSFVWKPLLSRFMLYINFAYRTFIWDSEASEKAHVHCVIIGFACFERTVKQLFSGTEMAMVRRINPYLIDYDNIFIEDRKKPLCEGVTVMTKGSQGTDDGYFYFSEDEYKALIATYPETKPYVREAANGQTFINGTKRYCLWCVENFPPALRNVPEIMRRLNSVREFRSSSPKEATRKWAELPFLFTENRQPIEGNYLLLPLTSGERRRYVPIGYLPHTVIANNSVQIMPNATLYDFGMLTSNVFMAWMRAVCGRLKSDYRITVTNVYNNFPWPSPTPEQRQKIEQTAQGILDARALYPNSSLADLYDPLTMPAELRKAHQANDIAVMKAYGMPIKETDEAACVAWLMRMYQEMVEGES